MFIPFIPDLSVPVFNSLGSGAVLSPTIGEVLAWMLIAALVGSLLGLLREGVRGSEGTYAEKKTAAETHPAPVAPAHGYREAEPSWSGVGFIHTPGAFGLRTMSSKDPSLHHGVGASWQPGLADSRAPSTSSAGAP
jgi:hypothetical protein